MTFNNFKWSSGFSCLLIITSQFYYFHQVSIPHPNHQVKIKFYQVITHLTIIILESFKNYPSRPISTIHPFSILNNKKTSLEHQILVTWSQSSPYIILSFHHHPKLSTSRDLILNLDYHPFQIQSPNKK